MQVSTVLLDQPRDFIVQPVQLHRCAHGADPFAYLRRRHELGGALPRSEPPTHTGLLHPHSNPYERTGEPPFQHSPLSQNFFQPACSLDARRIMIQAEDGTPYFWILLQHPQYRLLSHAAQSHIAVLLPALRVQSQKREQIDGRLEHIKAVAGPVPVEAVPGLLPSTLSAERLAGVVSVPLVSVRDNAVLILSDEHGVVILLILIDQPRPYKGIEYLTVNEALFSADRRTGGASSRPAGGWMNFFFGSSFCWGAPVHRPGPAHRPADG